MPKYLSAKEFRKRIPEFVEDLKRWGEIVVLKRSQPLFKVVPYLAATGVRLFHESRHLRSQSCP
jgi:hypothetical protein